MNIVNLVGRLAKDPVARDRSDTRITELILVIAAICEQFRIDAAWLLLGDASRLMFQHEQARVA